VRLLMRLGYSHAAHYTGGMEEWRAAGEPLERNDGMAAPLPAVRERRTAAPDRGSALVDLFERLSTMDLVRLWLATIVACALVYWLLCSFPSNALRTGDATVRLTLPGLLTALYFSFVTATSVGFGDVVPLGIARALAVAEAVAGLLIFGAVVSKLVSRRQERVVSEIHRIAFEDRLERVQTDLHLVLSELQAIAQLCESPAAAESQVRARVDSASGMCLAELRTIHDLLYRPETTPEEEVLEGILASLAIVLQELRQLLRCLASRSAYLTKNLAGLARLANEICSECVPRRYAPALRQWMDDIQAAARDLG
jgi:prepilin signal peptidase PulO-like enzyme (type II secretory pathway)